ncbi:MAG: hypothetical protein ABJA34_03355 [Pseudonocardiales bacterium]
MSNKVRVASAALGAAAVIGVGALAVPAIAAAASPSPSPWAGPGTRGGPPGDFGRHMGAEKELTGTTASKVKAAVLAKLPGATVHRMSAEDAAEKTAAAYEAHVTKSDGSAVEVLLDKNFKVISTKAERQRGGPDGFGPGGPGGPGGPHGRAETALTGTTASKVKAAVLAKLPGATVDFMSAEDPAETTGAAYEAHVTTSDASHVEVLLDKKFTVLVTRTMLRPGGFGGPPPGAPAPL